MDSYRQHFNIPLSFDTSTTCDSERDLPVYFSLLYRQLHQHGQSVVTTALNQSQRPSCAIIHVYQTGLELCKARCGNVKNGGPGYVALSESRLHGRSDFDVYYS